METLVAKNEKRLPGNPLPIKVDPRAYRVLQHLSTWLNDFQYRVLEKLICREVRRQGILLPPNVLKIMEELESGLGLDPADKGKLRVEE